MNSTNRKYKPLIRRCASDKNLNSDIFMADTEQFTFPNTTYWSTVKWSQVVNKLTDGFLFAKFKLDEEDKENDKHMKKICNDWIVVKRNNNWHIKIKKNERSVKIIVKSYRDSAEIFISPFLDKNFLAVEIRRWAGSTILIHRWLKYVIKYLEDFLYRRE